MTSFNILGSCCSRNAFNTDGQIDLHVTGYVQRQNPALILQKSRFSLGDDDIKTFIEYLKNARPKIASQFEHSFNCRMLKSLINGEATSQLEQKKGEWLLIDTFYFQSSKIIMLQNGNDTYLYCGGYARMIPRMIKSGVINDGTRASLIIGSLNYDYYLEDVVQYLHRNWGSKIILLNSIPCGYQYVGNTIVKRSRYTPYVHNNVIFYKFLKQLQCPYILLPDNVISRDGDAVHYVSLVSEYIRKCIEMIVSGDSNWLINQNMECLSCSNKLESMIMSYER